MSRTFAYIGNDVIYWKNLKATINELYPNTNFRFNLMGSEDPKVIQSYAIKVSQDKPVTVFIDLTSPLRQQFLHLTRIIARTNRNYKMTVCCLLEDATYNDVFEQAVLSGAHLIHVKSKENESIVYKILAHSAPKIAFDHGFVLAELKDLTVINYPARVSMINPDGITIESNKRLEAGSNIVLNNFWESSKIIGSKNFKYVDQRESDLFYPFKYSQKLEFMYLDLPDYEDLPEDRVNDVKSKFQLDIQNAKLKLEQWVHTNLNDSYPKFTKVLIVDRSLHFFDKQDNSDKHRFLIRCQPFLKEIHNELLVQRADLIVYRFDTPVQVEGAEAEAEKPEVQELSKEPVKQPTEEEEVEYINDFEAFYELTNSIKKIKDYKPFIITFNMDDQIVHNVKSKVQYDQLIVNKGDIDISVVTKMANILNAKLEKKNLALSHETIYLAKEKPETFATLCDEINILKISENDIYFTSVNEVPKDVILKIEYPVPALITVIEHPKDTAEAGVHYGIIHGVNEENLMEIRRFINSVFFRDKEEERKRDRDAFKELNENVRQDIEAAEQKARLEKQIAELKRKARELEEMGGFVDSDDKDDKGKKD